MRTNHSEGIPALFVEDTSSITEAEKYRWSIVFHSFVSESIRTNEMMSECPAAPLWLGIQKA
ncbi:hypothetical protein D3C76_129480 [compost metagenome]